MLRLYYCSTIWIKEQPPLGLSNDSHHFPGFSTGKFPGFPEHSAVKSGDRRVYDSGRF